jgi:hypothetical protein
MFGPSLAHLLGIESKAVDEEPVCIGDVEALERDVHRTNSMLGSKCLHLSYGEATDHLGLGSICGWCGLHVEGLGILHEINNARVHCFVPDVRKKGKEKNRILTTGEKVHRSWNTEKRCRGHGILRIWLGAPERGLMLSTPTLLSHQRLERRK